MLIHIIRRLEIGSPAATGLGAKAASDSEVLHFNINSTATQRSDSRRAPLDLIGLELGLHSCYPDKMARRVRTLNNSDSLPKDMAVTDLDQSLRLSILLLYTLAQRGTVLGQKGGKHWRVRKGINDGMLSAARLVVTTGESSGGIGRGYRP